MRVCMICEGSYPYVPGGVSQWVHMLCSNFKDIEFVIWSIATTHEEMSKYAYELPENIKEVRTMYIGETVFKRESKKIRLTHKEKDVLKGLMTGPVDEIDWEGVLDLAMRHHKDISDILMSEAFFDICLEEYQRQNSNKVFIDFLWNFRGIYSLLMTTLAQDILEADIYHSVSAGYAGILGSCASHVSGKPLLLSEHGIYTREREEDIIRSQFVPGDLKELWIDFFRKISFIAYSQASAVTTLFEVNKALQEDLNCPPEKIVIIPNGVEASEYDCCRKREKSDHVTIGAVLRVVPVKDVKTMLMAFEIVKHAESDVRLIIMGNCEEDEEYYQECLELLEELEVEDVEFLGKVNVKEHLPYVDLLLLSSISEGQPLAILEGMASEIPFVATDVGNCRGLLEGEREDDDFGSAGLIIPVMDSEAMARAIIRCIRAPRMREHMGRVGRRRVEAFYSRSEMLDAYRRLYERLGGGD